MEGIGFVTAVLIWSGAGGALAAAPHHHHRVSALGGSCRGSASAIAQYCEVIPGAAGGHHPASGTPTLSGTLPLGAVQQLAQGPQLRSLLRIPAAGVGNSRPGGHGLAGAARPSAGIGQSGADATPLWTAMILVLAAIAVLLGGAEALRRRLTGHPS